MISIYKYSIHFTTLMDWRLDSIINQARHSCWPECSLIYACVHAYGIACVCVPPWVCAPDFVNITFAIIGDIIYGSIFRFIDENYNISTLSIHFFLNKLFYSCDAIKFYEQYDVLERYIQMIYRTLIHFYPTHIISCFFCSSFHLVIHFLGLTVT